jgi:hypothetical protein
MTTITFVKVSKLKRIGERAFANCRLSSIRIPASVEKIDGSAFVGCPLLAVDVCIEVASGSWNFKIQGDLLATADGKKIVRYVGRGRKVIVPKTVQILWKSCFESCTHIESIVFESGSKLMHIGFSALASCDFLTSIAIPASVEVIEDSAFKCLDYLVGQRDGKAYRYQTLRMRRLYVQF